MKRLLMSLPTLALLLLSAGCAPAQHAVTTSLVQLTITPPTTPNPVPTTGFTGCVATGASSNDCQYAISAITLPAGTSSCTSSNGSNYALLPTATGLTTLTFVDSTSNGVTKCYGVQTIWNGVYSVMSTPAGPFSPPANPTAPGLSGGVVQQAASLSDHALKPQEQRLAKHALPPDSGVQTASLSGSIVQLRQ